jgi:D-alanyl-D-alanine-carboxypeptidase/D-alanyl-D-alanine-endopeptidase
MVNRPSLEGLLPSNSAPGNLMLPSVRFCAVNLALISGTVFAAPAMTPDIDTLASSLGARFVANPAHVGLSIGVIHHGVRKTFNFGSIDRHRAVPPTTRTIYELASLTKSYTGMLLAKAVLDGKLALDDDVRRYLPASCANLTYRDTPVRIIDLANHTAGLPKNLPQFMADASPEKLLEQYGDMSREDFLKAVSGVRLTAQPGKQFAYSNAGAQLVGIVLERLYGASYDALVERFIAGPLGMTDTKTAVAKADLPRYAMRYDGKGHAMPELSFWRHIPAAGSLKSTVADQLRYMEWNLDESDPVVALAHRTSFRGTDERGDDIGLYWFLNRKNGRRLVRHAGGSFGTTSFVLLYPDAKVGVVVLANDADASTEAMLSEIADKLALSLLQSGPRTQ